MSAMFFDGLPFSDRAQAILAFWFGALDSPDHGNYRKEWFVKDSGFDAQLRQQFLTDAEKAAAGDYDAWQTTPQSAVALVLLLDQLPRNLFRDQPRSFASDPQALSLAQNLVASGVDQPLIPAYRFFIYVPFEHSEEMANQNRSVALMQSLIDSEPNLEEGFKNGLDYAIRHREVIERFGRFPHRNSILNRASTPEEVAFLQQPGSRF
jgi:uncharacterized protein (DUF924 family)